MARAISARPAITTLTGTEIMPIIQSGNDKRGTIASFPLAWGIKNVKSPRYGAIGDGVTDDTAAILAAIAEGTGYLYFPTGTFLVTSELLNHTGFTRYIGAGRGLTYILFNPSADATCFKWSAGASVLFTASIESMTITTTDTTHTKIAMDVVDVSEFYCRDVQITGPSGTGYCWSGGGNSIGVQLRGRELMSFINLTSRADQPLVIEVNPNSTQFSCDQTNFHDTFLRARNTSPCIIMKTGTAITDFSMTGFNAWVGGTHGLWRNDTTSMFESNNWVFERMRLEQCSDAANSFDFYIQAENTGIDGLTIRNCTHTDSRKGLYFRNCQKILLDTYNFPNGALSLDVNATVNGIVGRNCSFGAGSTFSLVGQQLAQAPDFDNDAVGLSSTFEYYPSSGFVRSLKLGGGLVGPVVTVANNGTADFGSSKMIGFLNVISSGTGCALFHIFPTPAASLESDPKSKYSITATTAGRTNIFWNAGTSAYRLENKSGSTQTYSLLLVGSYNLVIAE